ncbi:MAG: hypothetical protein A2042_01370 [Candidatus Schekmanbacteria bacterium GWA2_38_11]|uniref:RND efflux pump membrane fusion protein barrel-sandwich domain-containing protein n=1 Tax=Candidatus Schekmanbacteria bacterium GWA2_38_11 TaxID=1817876 RepID=A0A1F7RAU8_9BACT|nr:MAG: hypothetical protein A2042_01370 [Candidatus Schekmanbacteria bacterium GWA2_38_11]
MSQKNKFKTAIILIIIFFSLIVFYRVFSIIKAKGALARDPKTSIPVEVSKVARGPIERRLLLTGTINPSADVEVFSKIAGKLEKVYVDVGDKVKKGELLAVIEHKDLSLQVEQAQATLEVSKATLEQAKVNYETARDELERMKSLFNNGTVSRQQYDTALSKFNNAKAQLKLSEAQANSLQTAALNLAKDRLDDSKIIAPISGIITLKNFDTGDMVSNSTSSQNNAIFKIEDIETVNATTNVPEVDLPHIKVGMEAQIVVAAFPNETFYGKVSNITPSLNTVTRTSVVEIETPNKDNRLKSGFFANIILSVKNVPDALLIPKEAILPKQGKNIAFVVNGGISHLRRVEIGLQDDKNIQVLNGLKEGEEVIITGLHDLEDGLKVKKEKI